MSEGITAVADVLSIAAVVVAVTTAVLGSRLRTRLVSAMLATSLAIVPGMPSGLRGRTRLRRACHHRLTGPDSAPERWDVAGDVRWLGRLVGAPHGDVSWSSPSLLPVLASALTTYARRLDLSVWARIGSPALAQEQAERARRVVQLLTRDADFRTVMSAPATKAVIDLRPWGVDVLAGPTWLVRDVSQGTSQRPHFDEIRTSWDGSRHGALGPFDALEHAWHSVPDLRQRAAMASRAQDAARRVLAADQDSYNGVLPRLLDWRVETSSSGPLRRLRLRVGHTSFATWMVTNGDVTLSDELRTTDAGALVVGANHLPVSVALVSTDGFVVVTQRASELAIYPDSFGSAANGNVELAARLGVDADVDADGEIDLVGAAARELREECGSRIDVGRDDLRTVALLRYTDERELASPLLVLRARSGQRLDEIVDGLRLADPVEGQFELGRTVWGVPTGRDTLDDVVAWLIRRWREGVLTTPGLLSTVLALAASAGARHVSSALDSADAAGASTRGVVPPGVRIIERSALA